MGTEKVVWSSDVLEKWDKYDGEAYTKRTWNRKLKSYAIRGDREDRKLEVGKWEKDYRILYPFEEYQEPDSEQQEAPETEDAEDTYTEQEASTEDDANIVREAEKVRDQFREVFGPGVKIVNITRDRK